MKQHQQQEHRQQQKLQQQQQQQQPHHYSAFMGLKWSNLGLTLAGLGAIHIFVNVLSDNQCVPYMVCV